MYSSPIGTHDDDIEPLPENLGYLRFPGEIPRISTTWSLPSPALTPENYAIPLQPELPALAVSESVSPSRSFLFIFPSSRSFKRAQHGKLDTCA
jgi:hypothetical protein